MLTFLFRRVVYTLPIMLGVALVCFALVHLSPGDPLVSILPPDASQELQAQLIELYGFNRSYPEQFGSWVWRALQGDLGTSIASGRSVTEEVMRAVGNTLRLAVLATFIGFVMGCLFGFVAGYFRNSWVEVHWDNGEPGWDITKVHTEGEALALGAELKDLSRNTIAPSYLPNSGAMVPIAFEQARACARLGSPRRPISTSCGPSICMTKFLPTTTSPLSTNTQSRY